MIQFKTLLRVGVAVSVATFGLAAQAVDLTISIPSCSSYSLINNVLTCSTGGGSPSASCSLTPVDPSVAIGTSITLTASCSNMAGPVTYTFGGCNSATTNTCLVKAPSALPAASVPISVTAADGTNNISKNSLVSFYDPGAGGGGGPIPKTCADGTSTVVGAQLSALDGTTDSVNINNNQTAIFPFVVPPVAQGAQIKITHFQTNDTTNSTPRTAYISQTPCDMPPSTGIRGSFPSVQWMFGFGGNTVLTAIVDGGNTVVVGKGGTTTPHMNVGDTWYLMFQNRDGSNRPSCTGNCLGNVSVKAQPGS